MAACSSFSWVSALDYPYCPAVTRCPFTGPERACRAGQGAVTWADGGGGGVSCWGKSHCGEALSITRGPGHRQIARKGELPDLILFFLRCPGLTVQNIPKNIHLVLLLRKMQGKNYCLNLMFLAWGFQGTCMAVQALQLCQPGAGALGPWGMLEFRLPPAEATNWTPLALCIMHAGRSSATSRLPLSPQPGACAMHVWCRVAEGCYFLRPVSLKGRGLGRYGRSLMKPNAAHRSSAFV